MIQCPHHGVLGKAFACRDVVIAVYSGGAALDVAWYESTFDGKPALASLICSGCIEKYQLPPSPVELNNPNISELSNETANWLATPICMKCFEEWRKANGISIKGNYPGFPT